MKEQLSTRLHSLYVLDCVCGKHIETREPEFKCGRCGRHGEIQGQAKPAEVVASEQKKERIAA